MKQINLVYDEFFEDADILLVPDSVYQRAEVLPGQYSEYLSSKGLSQMETVGFVEWLNMHICKQGEHVSIVEQHVGVSDAERYIPF